MGGLGVALGTACSGQRASHWSREFPELLVHQSKRTPDTLDLVWTHHPRPSLSEWPQIPGEAGVPLPRAAAVAVFIA